MFRARTDRARARCQGARLASEQEEEEEEEEEGEEGEEGDEERCVGTPPQVLTRAETTLPLYMLLWLWLSGEVASTLKSGECDRDRERDCE